MLHKTTTPDEYATLAAMWILASNDENHLMLYKGIQIRLDLAEDYDVRGLVRRYGDLFRQGLHKESLEDWRKEMLRGERLPPWMKEFSVQHREQVIKDLKPEDGFRSQFRTEKNAPRSAIVVIEWGLNHIERLRKAKSEARAAAATSRQVRLVFITSILGIAATIIAALLKR